MIRKQGLSNKVTTSYNNNIRTAEIVYDTEIPILDRILNAKVGYDGNSQSLINDIKTYLDELDENDRLHVIHYIIQSPDNSVTAEDITLIGRAKDDKELIQNNIETLLKMCKTREVPEYSKCPRCELMTLKQTMQTTRALDEPITTIKECVNTNCKYFAKE